MLEPYGETTHALQLQATAGYNRIATSALNGSAELSHWPVELLAFYHHRPTGLRIGGGPQFQINPSFHGTGAVSANLEFDNALGFVVQGDWLFGSYFSVYDLPGVH
jgi:hypothetical protein